MLLYTKLFPDHKLPKALSQFSQLVARSSGIHCLMNSLWPQATYQEPGDGLVLFKIGMAPIADPVCYATTMAKRQWRKPSHPLPSSQSRKCLSKAVLFWYLTGSGLLLSSRHDRDRMVGIKCGNYNMYIYIYTHMYIYIYLDDSIH